MLQKILAVSFFNYYKKFLAFFLVIILTLPSASLAAPRTNPFTIGQTLDPGAELTEPCGPSDTNCFVAVLGTDDEGSSLTGNVLRFNFVGSGVTATNSSGNITVTIPGGVSGLSSGKILIGNASNVATEQTLSGDATLSNTGVFTISSNSVTLAKLATDAVNSTKIVDASIALADLAGDSVNSSKIVDDSVVNADINTSANIALSKLANGTNIITSLATPSGSNANGGSISSNVLTLSLADGTNPGLVSTSAQTFAGDKTINNNLLVNGNITLGDASADSVTLNSGIITGQNATTLTTTAGNTLTLSTGTTGLLTLDSGTTGGVNLGTGANSKTITIGNTTGTTGLVLQSGTNNIRLASTTEILNGSHLRFNNVGNTFYTSLNAGNNTTNLNLTLPVIDGQANSATSPQALSTDGSGNLSFKRDLAYVARIASTTNGTLASAYENGDAIDGVTLTTGDIILLTGQSTASENGLYTVNLTGAPTLVSGFLGSRIGQSIYITSGTSNSNKTFYITAINTYSTFTPGATALSSLVSSTATNTIDNLNFAQTWNWSTADDENALIINANSLTSGKGLSLASSATAFTGVMQEIALTGNNAANTGTLLNLNISGASNAAKGLTIANTGTGISLDVQGAIAMKSGSTYTAAGSANDVNLGNASYVRLDTAGAAQTLTGISGGVDGKILTLANADASASVTFSNQSTSSTAANRIITGTGADLTIAPGASVNLIYDSIDSRWRVVGSTAGTTPDLFTGTAGENLSANDLLRIDSSGNINKIVTALGGAGTGFGSVGSEVTVDNIDISSGSKLKITAGGTFGIVYTAYQRTGATNYIIRKGTVSGNSTTWGPEQDTGISASTYTILQDIKAVGADQVVFLASNTTPASAMRLGTFVGNTVTWGTTVNPTSQSGAPSAQQMRLVQTNTNVIMGANYYEGNTSNGRVFTYSFSGNTLTYGSASTITTAYWTSTELDLISLSTNTAAVLSSAGGGGQYNVTGVSLSGTTISSISNTIATNASGSGFIGYGRAAKANNGRGILAMGVSGNNTIDVFGFSQSGQTITLGARQEAIDGGSPSSAINALDVACAENDVCTVLVKRGSTITAYSFDVSTINVSAPSASQVLYSTGTTENPGISTVLAANLSSNGTYTTLFKMTSQSNNPVAKTYVMGNRNLVEASKFAGFSSGAASTGASAGLKLISGVQTGLSGLTPGALYYINETTGALQTTATNYVAGRALSATSLQILNSTYNNNITTSGGLAYFTQISDGGDGNTYLTSNADGFDENKLRAYTAGQLRMVISNDGNVGIGTGASPTATLDIASTATTTNSLVVTANSLTSGKGLQVASSSTAFTGNLADISLSGNNVANTGNLLSLSSTGVDSLATGLNIDTSTSAGLAAKFKGAVAFLAGTTYTTAGSANNVALGNASLIKLDTAGAAQTLTGIAGGVDGKVLTLMNVDATNAVTLSNNSSSSSDGNKIITGTGADLTIAANASVQLIYDATGTAATSYWRVVGGTGGSSSSFSSTDISNLASGGAIGTAAATVDTYTNFNVNQTTASQTLTIPNPTNTTATKGKMITINNVGTANFTIGGITVPAGSYGSAFVWTGTAWNPINAASNVASGVYASVQSNSAFAYTATVAGYTASFASMGQIPLSDSNLIKTGEAAMNSGNAFVVTKAGNYELDYNQTFAASNNDAYALAVGVNGVEVQRYTDDSSGSISQAVTVANTFTLNNLQVGDTVTVKFSGHSGTWSSEGLNATFKQISGNLPVTGQSVDYVEVARTSNVAIANNGPLTFNTTVAGNIPYNSSTGRFTLTAGKTYQLTSNVAIDNNGASMIYTWYNVTASQAVGTVGRSIASNNAGNVSDTGMATYTFTPTVTTEVELRNITGSTVTLVGSSLGGTTQGSSARITQLGSTAATGVAFNSLTNAIATGALDNTSYAQTWNWSTATTETGLTLSANALTTGSLASITSSNNSLNSTNGLLSVRNTGTSTNGKLFTAQANSTTGSGLTVFANGTTGIGNYTAAATLGVNAKATSVPNVHIYGGSYYTDPTQTGSGSIQIGNSSFAGGNSALYLEWGGAAGHGLLRNSYSAGNIDIVASSAGVRLLPGGTSWTAISDVRLKSNVTALNAGGSVLEKISGLAPVTYDLYNGNHEIGLIAQDTKNLFPELVIDPTDPNAECSEDNQDGCYRLNYDRFGVVALAGIQELNLKFENGIQKVSEEDLNAWLAEGVIALHIDAIKAEESRDVVEYFTTKMIEGYKFVTDFASEKLTAIVGYFEKLFAKEATVETLCVGTKDNKTCITKEQLDSLLGDQGAQNNSNNNSSSGNTGGEVNTGNEDISSQNTIENTDSNNSNESNTDVINSDTSEDNDEISSDSSDNGEVISDAGVSNESNQTSL